MTITDDAREGGGGPVDALHHRPLPARQGDRPDRRGGLARPPAPLVRAARAARGAEGPRAHLEGEGRRDQQPGIRGGGDAARGRGDRARDRRYAPRRMEGPDLGRPADGRRGRDRPGRGDVDRHPGHPDRRGGVASGCCTWKTRCTAASSARKRRSGSSRRPSAAPAPGSRTRKRPIGSFIFLGPTGVGQDRARQGARRVHVRQRGRADQDRHERVHGAAQRQPSGRRASRLRRLRRGRPADRGRPPQELRRRAPRRDREGASRGLQHPAADPRGRPPVRCQGSPGRLPQLHHRHDLEPRRQAAPDQLGPRASGSRARPTPRARRSRTI